MSKVLIICAKRYNGHELWTLLGTLQQRNHTFEVVSTELLIRDELSMRPNTTERLVYSVHPDSLQEFDGVCVVSGNMKDTEAYWTDPHVQALLFRFKADDKMVAAICCSVPTLATVIAGIKVSFFPLIRSRQRLEQYGAICRNVSLTVDGKIVTAENQMITQMWGEEISNVLEGLPPKYNFLDSGYVPKGRPRRMPQAVQDFIDSGRK